MQNDIYGLCPVKVFFGKILVQRGEVFRTPLELLAAYDGKFLSNPVVFSILYLQNDTWSSAYTSPLKAMFKTTAAL